MGACISQKNNQQFSINDLNDMDKYYSILPKKKADILRWMTNSEGPWKVPESFACFQITDIQMKPIIISNEDEMRIHTLETKENTENRCKQTSNLYVDPNDTSMSFNRTDTTMSIRVSNDLDWSNEW